MGLGFRDLYPSVVLEIMGPFGLHVIIFRHLIFRGTKTGRKFVSKRLAEVVLKSDSFCNLITQHSGPLYQCSTRLQLN